MSPYIIKQILKIVSVSISAYSRRPRKKILDLNYKIFLEIQEKNIFLENKISKLESDLNKLYNIIDKEKIQEEEPDSSSSKISYFKKIINFRKNKLKNKA